MSNKKHIESDSSSSSEFLLKQICCITDDIGLAAAADEISYLKGVGVRYAHPKNKYELVRELGDKGGNVLHVACRDLADPSPANEWAIQLPNGGTFKPADLNQKGISGQIRLNCPLVFFNVYQSNPAGSPMIGMENWAKRFIHHGCGAILGCVWDIDSPLASDFVTLFYKKLISGLTLGQAVRSARKETMKESYSSWLAYYLYGSQNYRFRLL